VKRKKLIAPIIITTLLIGALAGYLAMYFFAPIAGWVKALLAVFFLGLIGVSIFVLAERIKEIKKGEEDDLSQY
jgi:hypothetical protein